MPSSTRSKRTVRAGLEDAVVVVYQLVGWDDVVSPSLRMNGRLNLDLLNVISVLA